MIPLNLRAQVKADIEADVMKGILERVPDGEPNTWCSRLVIQEKKNGKARRTVDLSYLSKKVLDESHYMRSAPDIANGVPGDVYKSTLDCVDGYHRIPLPEEDRHKMTFATALENCLSTLDVKDFKKIVDIFITWSTLIMGIETRMA